VLAIILRDDSSDHSSHVSSDNTSDAIIDTAADIVICIVIDVIGGLDICLIGIDLRHITNKTT